MDIKQIACAACGSSDIRLLEEKNTFQCRNCDSYNRIIEDKVILFESEKNETMATPTKNEQKISPFKQVMGTTVSVIYLVILLCTIILPETSAILTAFILTCVYLTIYVAFAFDAAVDNPGFGENVFILAIFAIIGFTVFYFLGPSTTLSISAFILGAILGIVIDIALMVFGIVIGMMFGTWK